MLLGSGESVHVDKNGKVGQMVALTGRSVCRGLFSHWVASIFRPRIDVEVPVNAFPVRETAHVLMAENELKRFR